jgi:acyl-coenzyme A thioesterase PaaI-like protein
MIVKIIRYLSDRSPISILRFFLNLYPPFIGAGIKIEEIAPDYKYLRVVLKLRFYNRNYVGTQFGGSIYAMTDPPYMLLLINVLGPDYIVWDKAAHIEFIKPGKTHLHAEFRIVESLIDTIKNKTAAGEKYIFDLPVSVFDLNGVEVAKVIKTLYVRKKKS